MKKHTLLLLWALAYCAFYTSAYAQLEVQSGLTAEEMAQILAGQGVEIISANLDCADGGAGSFNGEFANIGLNNGLLITSGQVDNAIGPNTSASAGTDNGFAGDSLLDNIASDDTQDACILEFQFRPFADELSFSYVFGSEEYPEYAPPNNSGYNDVFGFFISGPGIVGMPNIALLPNSTTPVSINNVNIVTNSSYYISNPENDPNSTVQYDGWTTVLTANISVIPCEIYTLRLAVADVGDGAYDSGVFIEAGSLSTNFVEVTANAVSTTSANFDTAIEGCVDGIFTFSSPVPLSETLTIQLDISGTAIEGEDYLPLPTTLTIPAGQNSVTLPVSFIGDNNLEGEETLTISYSLSLGCDTTAYQTATLAVNDLTPVEVSASTTTIFPGNIINLSATGGSGQYEWTPAFGLSNPHSANTTAAPVQTTTYTATSTVGSCQVSKSITITVITCDPNTDPQAGTIATNADFICTNESVLATAQNVVLHDNDVLGYALHNSPDGDLNMPGFVIYEANSTGVFTNNGNLPINTTLYISSIAGNNDGTGFPDLADPCLSVSLGYPIVFLAPVEVIINGSCDFITGIYHIMLSVAGGYPAYDNTSSYQLSGDYSGTLGWGDVTNLYFEEGATDSYQFIATDALGCSVSRGDVFYCEKTPISLLQFSGEVQNAGNMLLWSTATETNNDFFTLERATDAINFETIAIIDGAKQSTQKRDYSHLDRNAPNGTAYYRLSQTDIGGHTERLGIIVLKRSQQPSTDLQIIGISPMPITAQALVAFNTPREETINFDIFDIAGKKVYSESVSANTGENKLPINLANLSAGLYILHLTNGTQTANVKVVKN